MDYSVVLALVAGLLGVYYFFYKRMTFFKELNIPYMTPLPLLGNMGSALFATKPLAYTVSDIYNLNPKAKYVGFFDMLTPVMVICDLDLVKAIGVKNFEHFPNHRGFVDPEQEPLFGNNLFSIKDERWRDVRSLLSPTFTASKIKNMFKLMSDCAAEFSEFLAELPADKRTMEVKDAFTRYTNDAIATCAFGVSVNSMKDPKNEFYVMGKNATSFNTLQVVKMLLMRSMPALSKLFRMNLLNKKATDYFEHLITTMIRSRDEQNTYRPDMIQLMMEARAKRSDGKQLTKEEVTSNVFSFFFGGFDTSSTLMCFAAHEICVNPRVQQRLQEEIDRTLEETNGEVTYDAVNKLEYLEAVLNEALRMYPVAVFLDRVCTKEYELPPALPGGEPVTVKKGMSVWFPAYGFHHDPQYFEDPETFKPERFVGEKASSNPAFMPFGVGPRMCIANRFALVEAKVLMFHLLARCNLKPCSKTAMPMKLGAKGLGMSSANGYWMEIEPRSNPSRLAASTANGAAA